MPAQYQSAWLLVITFVVLRFLPSTTLDQYLSFPMGNVASTEQQAGETGIELIPGQTFTIGRSVRLYSERGRALGVIEVESATPFTVQGRYQGDEGRLPGARSHLRNPLCQGFSKCW